MKKLALTLAFSIIAILNVHAQNFQGVVVYESKTNTSDFKARMAGNREMTPEMQTMMEERMKKMFEKTFIMNFDQQASIYKEEEKLETPGQGQGGGGRMMRSWMGASGTLYKNIKEKMYTVDKEFMSKEFLVKDSLPKLEWKITGESRQIGGYNCFKATAVSAVSKSDFKNYRLKKEDDKKEDDKKEDGKKEDDKKEKSQGAEPARSTNFMDQLELPKEITVTAWFTPEIPVNQGPEMYWGLPGLILEVNDGKTVILCSKVVLNSKDKTEIKAPANGKVVTQKEYDEIVVQKMEEFRQMNQTRGGNGGNQFRMQR